MGPPSYMRSVVDRNVVMRRIAVFPCHIKHHMVNMYSGVKVQLKLLTLSAPN